MRLLVSSSVDASRAFRGVRLALGTFDLRRGDEGWYGNSRHEPAMIDAPNVSKARLAPGDGRHVHREGHQLEDDATRSRAVRQGGRSRHADLRARNILLTCLCHRRDLNPEPLRFESSASTSWTTMACHRRDSNPHCSDPESDAATSWATVTCRDPRRTSSRVVSRAGFEPALHGPSDHCRYQLGYRDAGGVGGGIRTRNKRGLSSRLYRVELRRLEQRYACRAGKRS